MLILRPKRKLSQLGGTGNRLWNKSVFVINKQYIYGSTHTQAGTGTVELPQRDVIPLAEDHVSLYQVNSEDHIKLTPYHHTLL